MKELGLIRSSCFMFHISLKRKVSGLLAPPLPLPFLDHGTNEHRTETTRHPHSGRLNLSVTTKQAKFHRFSHKVTGILGDQNGRTVRGFLVGK